MWRGVRVEGGGVAYVQCESLLRATGFLFPSPFLVRIHSYDSPESSCDAAFRLYFAFRFKST